MWVEPKGYFDMCVCLVTYLTDCGNQLYVRDIYVEEAWSKGIKNCVCDCVFVCVSVGVCFSSWC